MITTATEIKHFENNFEALNELGTEVNLKEILTIEFKEGLSNDINNFN